MDDAALREVLAGMGAVQAYFSTVLTVLDHDGVLGVTAGLEPFHCAERLGVGMLEQADEVVVVDTGPGGSYALWRT